MSCNSDNSTTNQFGICLNLGIIDYCWEGVERVKNSRRWSLSIVEEKNNKEFQKIVNRNFACNNNSGLGIFEIGVEIMSCIDNCLGILAGVKSNTTPNLERISYISSS